MKKILLRLDLNVPIDYKTNKILETERIDVAIPEIKTLVKRNQVFVLSHLGKGEKWETMTLVEKHTRRKLSKEENKNLTILENSRFQIGEIAKPNTKEFKEATKYFASFGEIYINDAFPSMHRPHASIIGVPELFKKENKKRIMGSLAKLEIKGISKSLRIAKSKKKTLAILSGAKISTKLPLIVKFLEMNVVVFVGGGIANQILKDINNIEIGKSFVEAAYKMPVKIKKYLQEKTKSKQLLVPIDVLLKNKKVETIDTINKNDKVCDIGPASLALIKNEIKKSDNLIINGPMGIYEDGFSASTTSLFKEIKKLDNTNKNILIGGGDTLFFTKRLKIKNTKNIFISTAGGAMMDFLVNNGDLPGIKALR